MKGYQLMHHGTMALADIEQNGVCVDVPYFERQMKVVTKKIERFDSKVLDSELGAVWSKLNGKKLNLDSGNQLAEALFTPKGLDLEPTKETKGERPATDAEALMAHIDAVPELDFLMQGSKLKTLRKNFIKNILNEQIDGKLHCFFDLHKAKSQRGSCSNINFQNLPNRDPVQNRIIRRGFVPSPGNQIVELDYSGAEVRIAACYHKDPVVIADFYDASKDMHRDESALIYKLTAGQVHDKIRKVVKNAWTFPQFYGDYYKKCAVGLYSSHVRGLKTNDGVVLSEHMKGHKATRTYGAFVKHLQQLEDAFWNEKFTVYRDWKEDCYEQYLRTGEVIYKTGFVSQIALGKNKALNYQIQGASFHCLLWSLIKLHAWMKRKGFKSKIIGQIHDSIVFDMDPSERDRILRKAYRISTQEIRKEWDWLIVPLEVEAEAAPVGKSWYFKEKYKIPV